MTATAPRTVPLGDHTEDDHFEIGGVWAWQLTGGGVLVQVPTDDPDQPIAQKELTPFEARAFGLALLTFGDGQAATA